MIKLEVFNLNKIIPIGYGGYGYEKDGDGIVYPSVHGYSIDILDGTSRHFDTLGKALLYCVDKYIIFKGEKHALICDNYEAAKNYVEAAILQTTRQLNEKTASLLNYLDTIKKGVVINE